MIVKISEILAAVSILCPSIISLIFISDPDVKDRTKIASYSSLLICPFSIMLHLYKAFGNNMIIQNKLYKGDVIFIHISNLVIAYSWNHNISKVEITYHIACIYNIIMSDTLKYPKNKNTIDYLAGLGYLKTSFDLFQTSILIWCLYIFSLVSLFLIHNKKLAGVHSSWIMHIMLAPSHYCMLYALENY
jgi:hypothetical protein